MLNNIIYMSILSVPSVPRYLELINLKQKQKINVTWMDPSQKNGELLSFQLKYRIDIKVTI